VYAELTALSSQEICDKTRQWENKQRKRQREGMWRFQCTLHTDVNVINVEGDDDDENRDVLFVPRMVPRSPPARIPPVVTRSPPQVMVPKREVVQREIVPKREVIQREFVPKREVVEVKREVIEVEDPAPVLRPASEISLGLHRAMKAESLLAGSVDPLPLPLDAPSSNQELEEVKNDLRRCARTFDRS